MTKRAYPFDSGVLRQFKYHINNFECDKAMIKDAESKTLEKLFAAQKSPKLSNWINNFHEKDNGLRQSQVTNFFSSKNKGLSIKAHKSDINANDELSNCSYCDCITQNVYKCRLCLEYYCHSCSFADYNMQGDENEGRICLTCS